MVVDKLDKKKRERQTNTEYLGQTMIDAGNEFGPGTPYGECHFQFRNYWHQSAFLKGKRDAQENRFQRSRIVVILSSVAPHLRVQRITWMCTSIRFRRLPFVASSHIAVRLVPANTFHCDLLRYMSS